MELNRLESEERSVKTQMTQMTQKQQQDDKTTQLKFSTPHPKKQQKQKTLPNKTLQDNQCRYCKNPGHKATDCAKLAKPHKLEENPVAARCTPCNVTHYDMETQQATLVEKNMKNVPQNGHYLKHRNNSLRVITIPTNTSTRKHLDQKLHHRRI